MALVLILAVLFSIISVSAQSATDLSSLANTDSFDWGITKTDIIEQYGQTPGMTCEESENEIFGETVVCSLESYGDGAALSTFFFDADETFAMVEMGTTFLTPEMPMAQMFEYMKMSFSTAADMEPYEAGKFFDALVNETNLVSCGLIPDTAYLCVLGVEDTEKPYISMFYIDPAFVTAFDEAE